MPAITKIIDDIKFTQAANDSTTRYLGDAIEIRDGTVVLNIFAGSQKIATRTLGTITDILGAGSSLRITYIDPSSRFVRFFPWLCLLLTLLMLASFRPLAPPTPVWGVGLRLALEGRDRSLRSKGRERVIFHLLNLWHHYTQAMSEALQSFPNNALQKSLSLGLIATIFFTSIPMPAFAAAAEIDFFYYHHGDHLGSTNVITEGNTSAIHSGITYSRGTLVQRFEYSPYGQESYVLNPGLDLEVSYTGQDYDVESGLYYYNSRYYNPQLGRFIQPDTIIPDATDLQSFNRYSYVNNNPIKYNDPTGHMPGSEGYAGPVDTGGGMGGNAMNGGSGLSYVGGILSFITDLAISSMTLPSVFQQGDPKFDGVPAKCNSSGRCKISISILGIAEVEDTTPSQGVYEEDTADFGAVLDGIQGSLDAIGLFFDPADFFNAGISLARGDYKGAAWNAVAIMPYVGSILKYSARGADAVSIVSKGRVVLGHFPNYTRLAQKLDAKAFSVPSKIWNKMSDSERWIANKKFIDRAISRGDDIILSDSKVKMGSQFERELNYLFDKGYKPVKSGKNWILVK